MEVDPSGPEALSREECLRLLATTGIGRIGFHSNALPMILPIHFGVDDGAIVVGVRAGTRLDHAIHDAVVAFEADELDDSQCEVWSVTVTGMASEIKDPVELLRVRRLLLGNAGGDAREHLLRISVDLVSGRRPMAVASAS